MPRYKYICSLCEHDYVEQRPSDHEQYKLVCNACGKGNYIEVME